MRTAIFIITIVMSFTQCIRNAAFAQTVKPTVKSKTAETRKASEKVSASLLKKLKAQAIKEARAEIAREQAAREQARLEALQELDAIAEPTEDIQPDETL